MPNDLTKRNLLNRSTDVRLASRQSLENKYFFSKGGGIAFIWTLSGVVLAACSTIDDILGLGDNDHSGGEAPTSGRSHFVQSSPVQGARLYFDMNNDKVIDESDMATQDGQYPQGFTTDETGEAHDIPTHLYRKSFIAVLDSAINAETLEPFPAGTRYHSIPDENGQHTLASPITDWIARQFTPGQVLTSTQVLERTAQEIAALLGHDGLSTLTPDEQSVLDALLRVILNPANYDSNDVIEALSAYLASNLGSTADELAQIALILDIDSSDTLIVVNSDGDAGTTDITKTIGTDAAGADVVTIYAVSRAGAVRYSIVDANGAPVNGGDFTINERTGVISVSDNATLTASDTPIPVYVAVTNGNETETVKVDITVQPVVSLSHTDGSGSVAENVAGAVAVEGIEVSGGTPTQANFKIF